MTTRKEAKLQRMFILALINTFKEKHLPYLSDEFLGKALKLKKTAIAQLLKNMEEEGLIFRETSSLKKNYTTGVLFRIRNIHGLAQIDKQQDIFASFSSKDPLPKRRSSVKKILKKSNIIRPVVENKIEVCYNDICCGEIQQNRQ